MEKRQPDKQAREPRRLLEHAQLATYSLPVDEIKCNLNFNGGLTFNRIHRSSTAKKTWLPVTTIQAAPTDKQHQREPRFQLIIQCQLRYC